MSPSVPPAPLPDVQAEAPARALALPAVGVAGVKRAVTLDSGPAIVTLTASVDLPAAQRGAHLSRFQRALDRVPSGLSLHDWAGALADRLLELHGYARSASVDVSTELALGAFVIPVTARAHAGILPIASEPAPGLLALRVLGSTACPCSFAMSGDRYAHVQRAELLVELVSPVVTPSELATIVTPAFSAPVALQLGRAAEKALVDRIFENPRFVEDVAREAAALLAAAHAGRTARVTATAFESIHPYDCFARWEGPLA